MPKYKITNFKEFFNGLIQIVDNQLTILTKLILL